MSLLFLRLRLCWLQVGFCDPFILYGRWENKCSSHKVLTEQCLASSELLTPHPLSTQWVCPPPAPKLRTRRAVRGWRVNISEEARHWIGLLQYNPSTNQAKDCHLFNILTNWIIYGHSVNKKERSDWYVVSIIIWRTTWGGILSLLCLTLSCCLLKCFNVHTMCIAIHIF